MSAHSSCLLCNGNRLVHRYVSKGFEIVECKECSFSQVSDPPSVTELERLYEDLHEKHLKFRDAEAAKKENQKRLRLLQQFVGREDIVLDAGCGTGDFLAEARNHHSVYGIDISQGAIDQARTRLPELSSKLLATNINAIDNHCWPLFDAICLWDVIEHIPDPINATRDLMRFLKPGGYLFLSTPDMASVTAKLMRRHWAFMIPPYHLGFFSKRSFAYIFGAIVPAQILYARTSGKWTSLGFLFYKLNQISNTLIPNWLLDFVAKSRLGRLNLYVPTNDILYLVAKKPTKNA